MSTPMQGSTSGAGTLSQTDTNLQAADTTSLATKISARDTAGLAEALVSQNGSVAISQDQISAIEGQLSHPMDAARFKEDLTTALLDYHGLPQGNARTFVEGAAKSGVMDNANLSELLSKVDLRSDAGVNRLIKGVQQKYEDKTLALVEGMDPQARNKQISNLYAEVFAKDPTATWFGLATIASDKVGDGLANAKLGFNGFRAFEDTDMTTGKPMWNIDENMAIVYKGFAEGNLEVFRTQYTAYQIFKDSGSGGLEAALKSEKLGNSDSTFTRELVKGYQAYEKADQALRTGDATSYRTEANKELRSLANYEQRAVLQPIYDATYEFGSVSNTLRGAISEAGKLDDYIPDAVFNSTEVNVLGKSLLFSGTEVGDADQRMEFVNDIADAFMEVYNQPDGAKQISDWHNTLGYGNH